MTRLFVPLFLLLSCAAFAAPISATVQIKEVSVYAKPSATAKFLGKLTYGTKLSVTDVKDDWAQIRVPGQTIEGWIRTQAYTTKKLDLKAGAQAGEVSSTEVSFAGRGFTEQIETDYRGSHPELDFATMDALETRGIALDELDAFLREAGLKPDGERK